ncbi:7TM domain-containing protein [Patescibacteria group bacterium]
MKNISKICLGLIITSLVLGFIFASPALAQTEVESIAPEVGPAGEAAEQPPPEEPSRRLEAVAGEDQNIPVGSKVAFDASKSVNSKDDGELKYTWDFGDGTVVEGVNEVHVYKKPGTYVARLTVDNGDEQNSDEQIVSVYENLVVLIADNSPKEEELIALEQDAARQGVLVIRIQDTSGQPDYIAIEELAKALAEQRTNIQKANQLIDWTSGAVGLNALTKFVQKSEGLEELDLAHKVIISTTDKAGASARIAQQTFDLVQPEFILLADSSVLPKVITDKEASAVLEDMRLSTSDYQIIGIHSERSVKELNWTNFMSYTINYMVNNGVPVNTIYLILVIPIIATIIALTRQIIGIKAFGLYIPTILTLAFLVTGIKYGLAIFIAILVVGTLIRLLLKYLRILYLPRMAIVLTTVAIAIFVMFVLGAYTHRTGFIAISIFPILIIAILSEEFVKVQIEKGLWTAVQLAIETLIISTACYYLVSWEALRTFFLSYPEIILFTIPINYILGKWTGLRIEEYIRFRHLRKYGKSS